MLWRLLVLLALLAGVLGGVWFSGMAARWPLRQARQALAVRDHPEADRWLDTADRWRADRSTTALLRARIHRRQSDWPAMEAELRQAQRHGAPRERVDRERLLAQAQAGQLQSVEPRLIRWIAEPGLDGADLCEAYANGLASQGRLPEADMVVQAWSNEYPRDPQPHVQRGRMAEHALEYDAAEQAYREALERNPEYPPALYSLARLLLELKREPAQALPLFQRCAAALPEASPAARLGEARCLRSLGETDQARNLLKHLVSIDDDAWRAAFVRVGFQLEGAPAALELGRMESDARNYAAATPWLRQAVEADPFDVDAKYALALALRGLGETEEAEALFEEVSAVRQQLAQTETWRTHLSEHPEDADTRYKLGMVYLKYQSPRLGIYWLQSALAHDALHADAHKALAEYYASHEKDDPSYAGLARYHHTMAQRAP